MASHMFITGEWGSVTMKLDLCRNGAGGVEVIETRTGAGILSCPDPEAAFFATTEGWFDQHGALPVILAGMVGSNIGWRDSGYVACPADAAKVAAASTTIVARGISIHFSPGLKCTNIFGQPDVVRGEEMQVFGWLARQNDDLRRLICLPGRHTKWLITEGRNVMSFFTGMTGELEDLLLTHGLLGKGVARDSVAPDTFTAGLDLIAGDPTLSMGHALFATRSRLVLGNHAATEAASFLKGLMIGADVRDSVQAHAERGLLPTQVDVLGHGATTELYLGAFARLAAPARAIDTCDLAVDGLATVLGAARQIPCPE